MALGAAATLLAVVTVRDQAGEADRRAAIEAARALQERVERSTAALRGANGLAGDGIVTDDEFAAFAASVLPVTGFSALAREVVVPGEQRQAFEAATGITIVDSDGRGGFVAAESRPEHVVVVDVEPAGAASPGLVGFDIAGNPVRDDAR